MHLREQSTMDHPSLLHKSSQGDDFPETGDINTSEALDVHGSDDRQELVQRNSTAVERLSCSTGHGDFCFDRLLDRHAPWGYGMDLNSGSSAILVPELDSFQR